MNKYNGTKCISCGKYFKDGDDIVVCPECGTPYHRECYLKEGTCINKELHEKGESWEPDYKSEEKESASQDNAQPIRCPRCGEVNPSQGLFCQKCGFPLGDDSGAERPFNDNVNYNGQNPNMGANPNMNQNPDMNGAYGPYGYNTVKVDRNTDIDGVKMGDYADYIGKNPLVMLSNFVSFGKTGRKVSLNIISFLFPELYFFYRKMYKTGILMMLLSVVLAVPSLAFMAQVGFESFAMGTTSGSAISNISSTLSTFMYLCSYLSMAQKVFCGLFANNLYYRHARKDILAIHSRLDGKADEVQIQQEITEKGGGSWIAVIIAFTALMVIELISLIVIKML
ncbi:MAG: RING finger protein [Oscillospiraceae bacterium]